jgi:hypothetical protein
MLQTEVIENDESDSDYELIVDNSDLIKMRAKRPVKDQQTESITLNY